MKRKHLFAAVIVVCTAAAWLGSCEEKIPPQNHDGEISVQTATAKVALPEVTLSGFIAGSASDVTSAGFVWGAAENELTSDAAAVITGNDFSVKITMTEADYNRIYYYRGYVVSKGETIYSPDTKSFSTDYGDKLTGKKWLELPSYKITDGRVAKAYYYNFSGRTVRNYSVFYDPTNLLSLWVAFPMNKDVYLGNLTSSSTIKWRYDSSGDIPISVQPNLPAGSYDYIPPAGGEAKVYERGHQIARADRSRTEDAATQTYMATNSTPQLQGFNGGIWGSLEDGIRKVVKENSMSQDTLYVVTGPMMSASPTMAHDKDEKECPIPEKYFKVVLWSKYVSDTEREYDSIGFIMENKAGQSVYANYALSVSEVERQTELEFFGNLGLGDAEMTALKSTANWSVFSTR